MSSDSDWSKDEATDRIREIARSSRMDISYKLHARERLAERGLIVSDVLYVLKNGFVHIDPVPATRPGYNRYAMECRTPNSGGRDVRVVVIPDKKRCHLKIISVMWVDEQSMRAGTFVSENEDEQPPLH